MCIRRCIIYSSLSTLFALHQVANLCAMCKRVSAITQSYEFMSSSSIFFSLFNCFSQRIHQEFQPFLFYFFAAVSIASANNLDILIDFTWENEKMRGEIRSSALHLHWCCNHNHVISLIYGHRAFKSQPMHPSPLFWSTLSLQKVKFLLEN